MRQSKAMKSISPRRSSTSRQREDSGPGKPLLQFKSASTSMNFARLSGESTRKRGLLSRRRSRRGDHESVGSTVAAEDSVSSESITTGRNLSEQFEAFAHSHPLHTDPYLPRRRPSSDEVSLCSRRSVASFPVDVDEFVGKDPEQVELSLLMQSMRMESEQRLAAPAVRRGRRRGPVDVDLDVFSSEEELEGDLVDPEESTGPVDVDDFILSSSSSGSFSDSYNDFSGRDYYAGKQIWEEDEDFDRGLMGYEEGFEPEVMTNAEKMFPPRPPPRYSHDSEQRLREFPPKNQTRSDENSRASMSTRAEC